MKNENSARQKQNDPSSLKQQQQQEEEGDEGKEERERGNALSCSWKKIVQPKNNRKNDWQMKVQ